MMTPPPAGRTEGSALSSRSRTCCASATRSTYTPSSIAGSGNVIWTEIWRSDDIGISWSHMGEDAKFPANLHDGYAQCWSWDYEPDDWLGVRGGDGISTRQGHHLDARPA